VRGRVGQGADVVVAQGVVDVLELAAGCGDGGDVLAAAGGDLVTERADQAGAGEDLDRLDRGPADQPGALLICGGW